MGEMDPTFCILSVSCFSLSPPTHQLFLYEHLREVGVYILIHYRPSAVSAIKLTLLTVAIVVPSKYNFRCDGCMGSI